MRRWSGERARFSGRARQPSRRVAWRRIRCGSSQKLLAASRRTGEERRVAVVGNEVGVNLAPVPATRPPWGHCPWPGAESRCREKGGGRNR